MTRSSKPKTTLLSNLFLAVWLGLLIGCQCQLSTSLQLGQHINGTVMPMQYAYYSIDIPDYLPPGAMLLVTVDSLNKTLQPIIYISDSVEFPTYNTSDESCFFQSLDTCSKTDLKANSAVYVSVFFYQEANFTIVASVKQTFPIQLGYAYEINFTGMTSGMVSFTIDEHYDQVLILLEYLNFYNAEVFEMVEAGGYMPNDGDYDEKAVYLDAYRKVVKLTKEDINLNMTYYLLLAGEQGVTLKLTITGIYSDQKTVPMNSSIYDLVTEQTTYIMSYPFSNSNVKNSLVIRMRELSGYGAITVNYCDSMNFTYQDMTGQNGQIIIKASERKICQQFMGNQGSLLVENIIISVQPYYNSLGISLNIYESNSTDLLVQINEMEYGMLQVNGVQKYRLNVYQQEIVNVTLVTYTYEGGPIFVMSKCNLFGCTPVLTQPSIVTFEYDPSCKRFCHYQLKVSTLNSSCKYGFVFKLQGYHIRLAQGKSDLGLVEMNEYVFYNITIDNATDITSVQIRIEEISGTLSFLTSQNYTEPTFAQLFEKDSDVVYIWNGTATYYNNLSQPIYVGVLGETQGMYRISYTVNRQENLPSSYTLLIDDVVNEFELTDQPLLLKYSPHSIPYSLIFYPKPQCLSYGNILPLPLQCMELPNPLNESVFINITGNAAGIVFRVYVDGGEFMLERDRPLFIQCSENCYEVVIVEVAGTERVVHSGYGHIINNQTKQEADNGVLELTCPDNASMCEMYVIAQLDYAGQMTLVLESSQIVKIQWSPTPIPLYSLPRKMFYRLQPHQSTVVNIDSRAAVLKVAQNVQLLNQSYSNLMELQFSDNYKQAADPFRRTYMVEISDKQLQQMGCNKPKALCVLTIQLDTDYEYTNDFLKNSVAYVSASTGTMFLSQNINYRRFATSEVQYYEYYTSNGKDVSVILTPIMNCRPKMIYSSKEGELPTLDNYEKISTQNISLKNTLYLVVGVVTEEELCQYDIILVTDTYGIQFLVEGVPQKIKIDANSMGYLLFNARSSQPFQIQSSYIQMAIYANKVPYGTNPINYLPGLIRATYSSQQAPLKIQPNSTANYVIAIANNHTQSVEPNIMIKYQDQTITLLHNTLYKEVSEQNQTDYYVYYSANSFYIYFLSSQGSFSVNVWSYPSYNQTFQFNSSTSSPWPLIQVEGTLSIYQIEVLSHNLGRYTLEVLELGSEGRPSLQPSLPFFDMFTEAFTQNCYKLQGAADNLHPLQVSFVFSPELKQKIHDQNIELTDVIPTFFYDFKSIGQDISPSDQPRLMSEEIFDQGVIYTMEQKYGTYTICFSSRNNITLDEDYYIITSSERLQVVVPSVPIFQRHVTDKFTSNYELVVLGNETVLAEIINCEGQSQLTTSTNYQEFLNGKTSQMTAHYSDGGYYSGMMNASRGYVYMGVQSLSNKSSYLLKITTYPANSQVNLISWKPSNIKLKLQINGTQLYIIISPLKCVAVSCNFTKNVTYHIYIAKNTVATMSYSRCGIVDQSAKILSYRRTYNSSDSVGNNVTIKVPLKLLPDQFTIACKAETVQSNYDADRTVPYFYGTTMNVQKSNIVDVHENQGLSWGVIAFVLLAVIVVLLAGLCLVFRQRRIGWFKPKPRVSFELQPLNNNQMNQTPKQIETQGKKHKKEERDAAPAYGEFVDESRL